VTTIQTRDLSRNNFLQHRNPLPQRAKLTPPVSSIGAASCLCAGADTDWPAVIDGCRDLLVVAFGVNAASEGAVFERACREADRKGAARHHLERLRRLLAADDISLERSWHELNRGAAASTVEALVYGLRQGIEALPKNPNRLRGLSELSEAQLKAVCRRVQSFNPKIATPWSSDEVAALIAKWKELHG